MSEPDNLVSADRWKIGVGSHNNYELRIGIGSTLKDKIKETIRVINRDVVDAEKQLREG